ncbi:restriction endonuclease subunit S [Ornithinibacillus halophilus]|uniref:Type I restriction enzyme, S subunit n=1 Tax=Ornithinibacillus halophilus TaxID=930117 RepID=A0A1M5JBR0_9BACI|nr:restriction endonuclease subunit S [Ornithinibacillus halophilus]SHG37941.1 type I restriction enzyme, S subunit [Ornithinibacillus halophilus]
MKNKLVPKRRFKEFKEVWKTVKIKDCIYYIKGFAFKSRYYRKEGIRIIRVSDLGTTEIIDNNEKIFIDRVYQRKYEAYKLNLGDIIITTVGSKAELKESAVGRPILVKRHNQGLLNQNLVKLSPINDYDSYFIYGNLLKRRYVDYIRSIERGNANQANITINDLWEYNINHGSTLEQQKIGEFFKVLDERIANQERKVAKVKALKSAYLTEMFPLEGETVPKRRFKEFEGEWVESKLGDLVEITMGHSPKSSSYTSDRSKYILVQGNADMKKNRVTPRIWTTQLTKMANKRDLILTVRAPVGEVGKTDYDVVLGRGVAGIKGNEFIFQYLIKLKMEGYWERLSTGSTFDSVNSDDINEVILFVPSHEEQQKIGQFFKNLDNQITTEEKKLEKLKKMKEAYLEEMFV